MAENKKLTPKRRFKEFENADAWKEFKVKDIAEFSKGNGYSKGDLLEVGTPIILYGRLYTKYQFAIDDVDTYAEEKNGAVFSRGNEVIVPASGETAEDIARASAVVISGVLLGGDLNIVHPYDYINPMFLALAISNGNPQKELAKKAQGKSVVHIHNFDIQEINIYYPKREEQDQIVNVFTRLDNLITLHQRKLEKAKALKAAFLSEMFPAEGEREPKRRFAGFTGAWEQRKLGECFDERQERSAEGELISVTINNGIRRFEELGRHNNSSEDKSHYKKVEVGDIAYNSMRMWQGASGYSPYSGILSPAYTVLVPKEGIDSLFFSYAFKKPQMIHTFQMCSQGITSDTWNLKYPALSEIETSLPKIDEQRQIGTFFAHLDNIITLHQQKLTKLQHIKKAYLNEMFIN